MSVFGTKEEVTLTVVGSRTVGRADGRVAIVLETKEAGAIAFEVDARAIAALRGELGPVFS
jgi:hypothetical protein